MAFRGDTTGGSAGFAATGLTGLDTTGTVCSFVGWLRYESPNDCDWFSQMDGAFKAGIAIGGRSTGEMRFFVGDAVGQTNNQSPAGFMLRGLWAHYAIAWDGTTIRFYRNGALHSTAALTATPTAGGTRFTNQYFNTASAGGSYYDVRWFPNILLSAADVRATMDPRRTVVGAAGRWFRDAFRVTGASVSIPDESGNGNALVTSSNPDRSQLTAAPPFVSVIASTQRRTRVLRGVRKATTAASVPTDLAHARGWQPLLAQ